ncbi:glucokinase [Alginatibacterium sediminis]|uniref:Glucokinase n=1 Tax=Alginatibacterium sediminis TaxID=2164068 RepID=A0A420EHK2_9ALTE|nr:glucokinase [Alginatibacterium sediminis]RKF20179.1 glucokinase [Alginatibacterium sediminis]
MSSFGLIADVGGTNIRLATIDLASGTINNIHKFLCGDYPSITDVMQEFQSKVGVESKFACIAIACPTDNDWIDMTNNSWAFSQKEVAATMGFEEFHVINDFTGIAMSLPTLKAEQLVQVGGTQAPQSNKPIAVYGPGTGLGVAHLMNHGGEYICLPGEGGHVEFAASDDTEAYILAFLQQELGHVSAERLISGPGLVNIYRGLCQYQDFEAEDFQPADITERGLSGECIVCRETLEIFCRMLGSFGGNLALNLLTYGGVYIAGGIVSRFMEFFLESDFRTRFEDKGRFSELMKKIPVFVITEEQPGLQGAGAYLRQSKGYKI